ncbi:zinc ribbon domain-containing protein [Nocardioides sp. YIM 152588]|uniref:thiolase C-terminal domain-containing protein n=1 Tax=Nocardioides sp. YIM 152588 TaxID=3158259 RepID=UPI0032E47AC2
MSDLQLPVPFLTPVSEFFYTSGADGLLRVQRCRDCSGFVHPPKPRCPHCRGRGVEPEAVSGRGILVGFSESTRFAMPGLPNPVITGTVAVEEDTRVRIAALVVDAAADDLRLGMVMEVRFVASGEYFVPVFAPAAEQPESPQLPEDELPAERVHEHVRPMVGTDRFEDRAVISGVGHSRLGRRLMVDPLELTMDAAEAAIADAGLTVDDIDGLSTYPGGGLESGFGEGGVTALEAALRIRPTWYNGGGDTFGPSGSIIAAIAAVSAGLARHVLCFRTLWASTHETLLRAGKLSLGRSPMAGDMGWLASAGVMSAAQVLGQHAQRYFHRYGATRETLGWIALNQRANAALHPDAIYRDPLTMDDYLGARPVTTPFGLYDCDVPCDGSIAVIVSAVDVAGDLPNPPVRIEAAGTQLIERPEWIQSTSTHEPQVFGPAAHLWSRTDLRPDDVDVALLYDGFTFNCLSWIEGLGFCEVGEAKDFLDGGKNIARDGLLPLNPHGGQLSHGRTHGMGLVEEAVLQLRGAAGERQVADARTAVVSSGGLTPSGVLLLRSDR